MYTRFNLFYICDFNAARLTYISEIFNGKIKNIILHSNNVFENVGMVFKRVRVPLCKRIVELITSSVFCCIIMSIKI